MESKNIKSFIGSTLIIISILFILLSIALIVSVIIMTKADFKFILDIISQGSFLINLPIGLIATGIISLAFGLQLRIKN